MPTNAEIFEAARLSRARALLAGGQPLPLDLRSWVIEQLEANASAEAQRARRDAFLVQAASMVTGRTRARALAILAADSALNRTRGSGGTPSLFLDTVRKARSYGDLPGERQLRKIITTAKIGIPAR